MREKKRKVEIFVDASNFHYGLKKAGWKIDYRRFRDYFNNLYDVIKIYYYEGIPSENQYRDRYPNSTRKDFLEYKKRKKEYFKILRKIGIIVRTKTVGRVYDNTKGEYKYKCNFDVELTIDSLNNIENYEEIILCSGDGDFTKLIKHFKRKFKKTTVIALRDRFSHSLFKSAHKTIYLDTLRHHLEMIEY